VATSSQINLISNPSVDKINNSGKPIDWNTGSYGTMTRTFSYPVAGNTGNGVRVDITGYNNGDAKWYFKDVPVTPGKTYRFSDYYSSNVSTIIDVRYLMSDGTYKYFDLANVASNDFGPFFKPTTVDFVVPNNVVSLTIFHLINRRGYLATDDFSLIDVTPGTSVPPPVQNPSNFIPNPGFESVDSSSGLPLNWKKGGWGTNTKVYTYPITSYDGSKAVSLSVTSYTSGDAKWYFTPIASLTPGTYTYSENFNSNIASIIELQYQLADGTFVYKDIGSLPASSDSSYNNVSADVFIPTGATNITMYHLIEGVGTIKLDNTSLVLKKGLSGIFTTGAVTFRLDDAYESQYQNALPKLNSDGFKATFFVPSQQLLENGFSGFMSIPQLKEIFADGDEIAAHTRTHPHLLSLSPAQQQNEIAGSKSDLTAMGLGPITSFSYPYGEYDSNVIQIVKNAGFSDAVSVIGGYGLPTSDKYQLERKLVDVNTTVAQVQAEVDEALRDKKWLILEIHQVDTSGDLYSVTPNNFKQILDYVKLKQIPVVTINQGVQSL